MKAANTGDDIPDRVAWVSLAEEDLQALLRVARAAKNRKREGMTFDEIGEAQDEFEDALKEVDHLL